MIIRTKKRLETDFHTHILPCMDDGSMGVSMSENMLAILREQGIETVAATSHFDAAKESVHDFLERRKNSFAMLGESCDLSQYPRIVLGAEIYFAPGTSKIDLSSLCYGDTDYLLLELPRLPYGDWIVEELEVIAYKQKLVPVIAHIDRYMDWYSKKDIDRLLSFDDVILQVNNNAFSKKKIAGRITDIIKSGYTVILGSDTHDDSVRRPNFDEANKILDKFFYKKSVTPHLMESIRSVHI